MALAYVDALMAFLANGANRLPFVTTTGLPAFALTSFTRRYVKGAFVIDGAVVGAIDGVAFQVRVGESEHVTGTIDALGAQPRREQVDYRHHRVHGVDWIDAHLSATATFAARAVPGTLTLGPGADVARSTTNSHANGTHDLAFAVGFSTDAFQLNYPLDVYVFAASQPAPRDDLRRIASVRAVVDTDPRRLAALDDDAGHRAALYVQCYPGPDDAGSEHAAIAAIFDAADVHAAFFTPPT